MDPFRYLPLDEVLSDPKLWVVLLGGVLVGTLMYVLRKRDAG